MDRSPEIEEIGYAVVSRGVDDWVCFAEVDEIARSVVPGVSRAARLATMLDAIEALLRRGWVAVGGVDKTGFVAWSGDVSSVVRRIAEAAAATGQSAYLPGDVCWLQNTPVGDEIGRDLPTSGSGGVAT